MFILFYVQFGNNNAINCDNYQEMRTLSQIIA